MLFFYPRSLICLLLIVLQVSSQYYPNPSITCYTSYEREETKSPTSGALLSYSYRQAEITQYAAPTGELCSNVGCVCFSYRAVCSYTPSGSNHFSQCTEADRQNRVTKWHRGWTSLVNCEQMRQQPQVYPDLTCCHTDRCNDQPGTITKITDPKVASQQHGSYRPQPPQPFVASYAPSTYYTSSISQKPLLSNAAFLPSSCSSSIIVSLLILASLSLIQFH